MPITLLFVDISIKFYILGAEYCPYDYIKIYDGKNASSPEIGTFCGMGKFPHSIVGTSEDLFVEFVTSPAGTYIILKVIPKRENYIIGYNK